MNTHPVWPPHSLPLAATDPDESVRAAREALDPWWGRSYPWYDSQSDGVRRVEIAEPRDWDWLRDLWPDGALFSMPDSLLQWTAWMVIALLLAGVSYLLIRAYFMREGRSAAARAEAASSRGDHDSDRTGVLPFSVRGGPPDLLAEATKYYHQGDYGRAIVYLFSFQLVQLDKRQIIRLAKGKTNRQYLREVGRRGTLHGLVGQTMEAFEDVFFGHHALDRARFESCWSRLGEFQSLTGEATG